MSEIAKHLEEVRQRIAQAAAAASRNPAEIRLLAVSKTFPAADVRAAFDAGQRAFGENYVQEAVAKIAELADLRRCAAIAGSGAAKSGKPSGLARAGRNARVLQRAGDQPAGRI